MKSRAFFLSVLALTLSILSFGSTVPVLTVVSPVSVNSGGTNDTPYSGPNPVHFVAYATSSDCTAGIAEMRIYSSSGVLAYSTLSSFLDEELYLQPGSYSSTVEVTDNCGGISFVHLKENVQHSTGEIIVTQPISNLPYQPGSPGITISATARTSCAQGVDTMEAYISGREVGRSKGGYLAAGAVLPVGSYSLTVTENDNCGGSTTTPLNLVIQKNGLPLSVGVYQFAYMPNASTGTIDEFYIPLSNCSMTPLLGNPSPAGDRPWATARSYPFLFVLNQRSASVSVYYMDLNVSGELTQIPGSPFSLQEAAGYLPTGIAVPAIESIFGSFAIYVTNSSSDGTQPGTLGEYTLDVISNKFKPMLGSPLTLRGNVQPTAVFVGPQDTADGHFLLTTNGSSISVLDGTDLGTRYESDGSPDPTPGRYGSSAGVQDIAQLYMGEYPGYLYTANSENSISAFELSSYGTLTQLAGSPYANPDDLPGTSGNPASVTVDANGSLGSHLYTLNSGPRDIGIFSLDMNTGIPTYVQSQHKGLIDSTPLNRIRAAGGESEVCMVTSNGYSLLIVDQTTGLTAIEPGSPFLVPDIYPALDLGLF